MAARRAGPACTPEDTDMLLLSLGIVLFIGVHLVPSVVPLRHALVVRLGEERYKRGFALVAFAGLALLVVGKARAPHVLLWTPPPWGHTAALTIMPLALTLLAASSLPSNIRRYTAHPMLWGVFLWASAHLLASGDRAAILLFGSLALYALYGMWSANRRGANTLAPRVPRKKDAVVLGVGVGVYLALLGLHPYLFGVSAL
jgi:uncharacterized membrane protein